MSILIKRLFGEDMPMPQEGYVDIRIHFKSGKLRYVTMPTGEDPFYAIFDVEKLPPHGRLADLDEMIEDYWDGNHMEIDEDDLKAISQYKVVIEAEGSET